MGGWGVGGRCVLVSNSGCLIKLESGAEYFCRTISVSEFVIALTCILIYSTAFVDVLVSRNRRFKYI